MPLHAAWRARIRRRIPWTRPHAIARTYAVTTDPAPAGDADWFQQLRTRMLRRPPRVAHQRIDVETDRKLADALCSFLPRAWSPRPERPGEIVPLGHHFVWFNASVPVHRLLSDGTDPLHSPGRPWVRRMWAGGSLQQSVDMYYHPDDGFALDANMVCTERIRHVQLRGTQDAQKIFVTIERRYANLDTLRREAALLMRQGRSVRPPLILREQMVNGVEGGHAILKEERKLVFLKEKTPAELDAIAAGQLAAVRYLNPPAEPDFSHSLVPTRTLLFQYSALTHNAHLIHLDQHYARNVEGHRHLLVHGPLTLTLMLQVMRGYLNTEFAGKIVVASIHYQNLAPLYCNEEMRICIKRKNKPLQGPLCYQIWIEVPPGRMTVKGEVQTSQRSFAPHSRQKAMEMRASGSAQPYFRKVVCDDPLFSPRSRQTVRRIFPKRKEESTARGQVRNINITETERGTFDKQESFLSTLSSRKGSPGFTPAQDPPEVVARRQHEADHGEQTVEQPSPSRQVKVLRSSARHVPSPATALKIRTARKRIFVQDQAKAARRGERLVKVRKTSSLRIRATASMEQVNSQKYTRFRRYGV
ncbi:hypothetical protein ACEQ8H_002974 [Pleosporales sp. CAS-2024a]